MMLTQIQSARTPTPVTYVFATICILVTLTGIAFPATHDYFGAYSTEVGWAQRFTVSFQHGFDAVSALLHLSFNMFVLWHLGRFSEKILGSSRYLLITLTAILAYALVHWGFHMEGHGSSGVIWAYGPIVLFALIESRRIDPNSNQKDPYYRSLRQILIIIWILVSLFMALIPMQLSNNQIDVGQALFYGNLFHISGTAVGFLFALVYKKHIRAQLQKANDSL